jgi:hypothetical protein
MKTVISLVLLLALGAICTEGQDERNKPKAKAKKKPAAAQGFSFSESAKEIRVNRPEVRGKALDCDTTIILSALPEIKSQFAEKGFTEKDSFAAALDGWKLVRLESPLQGDRCMHRASFQQFTVSLGRLVFRTTPDHADIEVRGKPPINKQTLHSIWYEPRTYQVKYSKEDYEATELECTVLKGESTDCYAELKKKD